MMIYTPGRGSVNTRSQYLIAITIIWLPSPPESTILPEQTADEMRSTPGIKPGNYPGNTPQPDGSCDGRNVDHDAQPDADTSVEQPDPTPTNRHSSKYDLRHNPKPNCNDDYRY